MATTAADPVQVDTNVLIYSAIPSYSWNPIAKVRLDSFRQEGSTLCLSRQILRGYVAVLTRPRAFTPPISIPKLIADVTNYQRHYRILEDGSDVTAQLLALLGTIPVGGRQFHDASPVATMLARGIPTLLTHNMADFAR